MLILEFSIGDNQMNGKKDKGNDKEMNGKKIKDANLVQELIQSNPAPDNVREYMQLSKGL